MNVAYTLSGGAPVIKKYRVASGSTAKAGGYVTNAAAGGSGVVLGLATTAANQVGSTLDAATGSTTPTSDATALTSVVINPDAVYKLVVVKGATGGQLDILTESSGGSKTANTITTGETAPNSPEMDEGTIICMTGANKGQVRKITSTSSTVATITEGWVNNNVAGDQFIMVPFTPGDNAANNVNLTTDLASARQDIAVGTGADMRTVELIIDQGSLTLARNGGIWVLAMFDDMIYNVTT
jgi:hypothetical protein